LDLIDIFLAGICQIPTNSRGVFRVKHPHISELHISHPQKGLSYTIFWAIVRENWFTGMG